MKYIFTLLLAIVLSIPVMAQFKIVEGSRTNTTIHKEPINLDNAHNVYQTTSSASLPTPLTYIGRQDQVSVESTDLSGKPIQFVGTSNNVLKSQDLLEQASAYFDEVAKVVHMSTEEVTLTEVGRSVKDDDRMLIRTVQTYKGLEIYGAEMIFHGKDGRINMMHGDYISIDGLELTDQPELNEVQASEKISQALNGQRIDEDRVSSSFGTDFKQQESRLMWYSPDFKAENLKLVWYVIYYPNLADRYEVMLDAQSGEIIRKLNTVCKFHNHSHGDAHTCVMDGPATAVARDLLNIDRNINTYEVNGTYYLIDATKAMFSPFNSDLPNDPAGVIWTLNGKNNSPQNSNFDVDHISSGNNTWTGSPEGVSAHYNAEKAYEYFKNTHTRESINGSGGNIVSIVNVADENGNDMDNAFWNGFAIFYGNGDQAFQPLGRALDVAGHEMSHGVVQNTANLEYYGESGAINESVADIFGAMIDRDDWQMGEDVVNTQFFPSGALRDLQDPHNGAATNDFQRGWQPKHTSEQFNGPEDNNGVHINSGIPNHAFYLFATDIGKAKAEKIWYLALTDYLTKSSQFVDLRNAVINATQEIHGQNAPEVAAAQDAFSAVGIGQGSGTNNQNDAEVNPGEDLLLMSGENTDRIYIADIAAGSFVHNPLSTTAHRSKPSITDDGSTVIFIGEDNKMYRIRIDWETGDVQEQVIQDQPIWRNAVISKDGSRVAAITEELENVISVFDFGLNAWNDYTLYNPTFTEGIETGDVDFADAMEFDITGEILMYDAQNIISSATAGEIKYFDIGFLEVWNNAAGTWRLGNISKLFTGLPEGISIGNPTYSKNSPYIVAFDFIEDGQVQILGANSETGDVGLIHDYGNGTDVLGYPSYSKSDDQIAFDLGFFQNGSLAGYDIGMKSLQADKITEAETGANVFAEQFRWATWFSNGERILSDTEDELTSIVHLEIQPNPAGNYIEFNFDGQKAGDQIRIYDVFGKLVLNQSISDTSGRLNIGHLQAGTYVLQIKAESGSYSSKFVKG